MWKNVKMTLGRRLTQTLRRRNPVVTLENLMKNVKKKKKKVMSRPEACCITLKVERRNIPPVFEERGTTTVDQITHTQVYWEFSYMSHL